MKDINRITLADMIMDIFSGYVQGYIRIYQDMLGYLNWISFLGYDFQSYPNSQKISLNILTYPIISYHILSYPKISLGANSQVDSAVAGDPLHGLPHVEDPCEAIIAALLVFLKWLSQFAEWCLQNRKSLSWPREESP